MSASNSVIQCGWAFVSGVYCVDAATVKQSKQPAVQVNNGSNDIEIIQISVLSFNSRHFNQILNMDLDHK